MKWFRALLAGLVLVASIAVAPSGGGAAPFAAKLTSHGPVCIEAQAFIARAAVLDQTHVNAYTDYICTLVTGGVWSASDAIYLLATQTSAVALLNLKSTSFTATSSGTIPFTKDRGFVPDGVSGHLDTGFNPSTAGGNFAQNDAHISVWNAAVNSAAIDVGIHLTATGNWTFVNNGNSGTGATSLSTTTVNDATGADGVFAIGMRTGASASSFWRNGIQTGTGTAASAALPNVTIWIGCGNDSGSCGFPVTNTESAVTFGKSLTAAQAMILFNATAKYMRAVGAYN